MSTSAPDPGYFIEKLIDINFSSRHFISLIRDNTILNFFIAIKIDDTTKVNDIINSVNNTNFWFDGNGNITYKDVSGTKQTIYNKIFGDTQTVSNNDSTKITNTFNKQNNYIFSKLYFFNINLKWMYYNDNNQVIYVLYNPIHDHNFKNMYIYYKTTGTENGIPTNSNFIKYYNPYQKFMLISNSTGIKGTPIAKYIDPTLGCTSNTKNCINNSINTTVEIEDSQIAQITNLCKCYCHNMNIMSGVSSSNSSSFFSEWVDTMQTSAACGVAINQTSCTLIVNSAGSTNINNSKIQQDCNQYVNSDTGGNTDGNTGGNTGGNTSNKSSFIKSTGGIVTISSLFLFIIILIIILLVKLN